MRSEDEIYKVHDLLHQLVNRTLPVELIISTETEANVTVALGVLCWVLGHEGGIEFADFTSKLSMDLAERGIVQLPIWSLN